MRRASGIALAFTLCVACGGSDDGVAKDVSPTTPANGAGSSSGSSSGSGCVPTRCAK